MMAYMSVGLLLVHLKKGLLQVSGCLFLFFFTFFTFIIVVAGYPCGESSFKAYMVEMLAVKAVSLGGNFLS